MFHNAMKCEKNHIRGHFTILKCEENIHIKVSTQYG
jgi:hypothetical protein